MNIFKTIKQEFKDALEEPKNFFYFNVNSGSNNYLVFELEKTLTKTQLLELILKLKDGYNIDDHSIKTTAREIKNNRKVIL